MPGQAPARRARGPYSPLICTRCRARKIKCVLPAETTSPSPDHTPQPVDKACQRCRQNGFDCVVESTTLGRPNQQRAASSAVMRIGTTPVQDAAPAPAPSTEGFLLSQPYHDRPGTARIPAQEVCEALSTPLRFLAVLLGRHPGFGIELPYLQALNSQQDILHIVPLDFIDGLDTRLHGHRLYYPYFPALRSIRDRLAISPGPVSSIALYLLLCLMALETDPQPLNARQKCMRPSLQRAFFHYAHAAMINPPAHRDTVTLFQLVAEYRPLSLLTSRLAIAASLTDSIYYTVAKRAATSIGLDRSLVYLSQTDEQDITPELVLEAVQWLHLVMSEGYAGFVIGRWDPGAMGWIEGIESAIDRLEHLLFRSQVLVLEQAHWRVMQLVIAVRSARARVELFRSWRDLPALGRLIQAHEVDTAIFRASCMTVLASANNDAARHPDIGILLDAELHKHHLGIKMSAMFFAIMASAPAHRARQRAQFSPDEVMQMPDHLEERLKAPMAMDEVHQFMAVHGHSTADEIEKQLTDFVHLLDQHRPSSTASGFQPPIKTYASEVLHSCYHLVQQNAARLKGWGGFHDRVDTHLIVLQSAARGLESLARGTTAEGDIMAATASLVMDLHGILATWRKRFNEDARAIAIFSPPNIPSATIEADSDPGSSQAQASTPRPPVPCQAPGAWADDFFASWNMWPQPEDIDFSQFIDFDYDPEASTG